ncbi:MAG: substrate-binding domain-containing protein [Promicromonosporaceae bacterium]|nr:substrate-binding domain-containing protein [Promicromonosporaceae bacterium]
MKRMKVAAAATAFLAGAALVASAATASADVTPQANDIVGVGSDTIQIVMNDIADGAKNSAGNLLAGFNSSASGRLISFDATNPGTGKVITGDQITLRPGSAPINRPNGSGAGKGLLYGASNNPDISFARSSDSLSADEISGGLVLFPFATDGLEMAVAPTGSHAPATLSAADVLGIYTGLYTHWNDIPGNSAGSTDTINALMPQGGSGTLKYFTKLMTAANGNVAPNLSNGKQSVNGVIVEEHDPSLITNDPDAIAPFSTARATTTAAGKIKLVEGGDSFTATRPVYVVVRSADLTKPWVGKLFGTSGYLCGTSAKALINAAGFPQLQSLSKGGVCGKGTTSEPTNLATS